MKNSSADCFRKTLASKLTLMGMSKHNIRDIFKRSHKAVLEDIRGAAPADGDQIHQLRVDIKKFRSICDLLHESDKDFISAKLLKSLKPIYNAAGKIRTADVNLHITQPYKSAVLLRYKDHLRQNQDIARQTLQIRLEKFKTSKFRSVFKDAEDELKHLKKKKLKKEGAEYLRVRFAEVRADVFDTSDDKTLHKIRKKLRQIKTIASMMDKMSLHHPFEKDVRKMTIAYDKLGVWHDLAVLIDDLEKYVEDLEDAKALEKTTPLLVVLKRYNLKNKKQIEKRLKTDLVMDI
jgi:CHAD domain-containing protein